MIVVHHDAPWNTVGPVQAWWFDWSWRYTFHGDDLVYLESEKVWEGRLQ